MPPNVDIVGNDGLGSSAYGRQLAAHVCSVVVACRVLFPSWIFKFEFAVGTTSNHYLDTLYPRSIF